MDGEVLCRRLDACARGVVRVYVAGLVAPHSTADGSRTSGAGDGKIARFCAVEGNRYDQMGSGKGAFKLARDAAARRARSLTRRSAMGVIST
eukprot:1387368-Pleurochrysis_carterae.AAC.1